MYTYENVVRSILRVGLLRQRLCQPDARDSYDHNAFIHRKCGTPGCALGFCTTIWPDEIWAEKVRPGGGYVLEWTHEREGSCIEEYEFGARLLGIGLPWALYLFVVRDHSDNFPNAISGGPNTLEETLRRLDVLDRYLRNKLRQFRVVARDARLLRPVRWAKRQGRLNALKWNECGRSSMSAS